MDEQLTPRQFQIAELYIWTGSRKAVAAALGISTETVKVTLRTTCERLGIYPEELAAAYMVRQIGVPESKNPAIKYGHALRLSGWRQQESGTSVAARCIGLFLLVMMSVQTWGAYRLDQQPNDLYRTMRTTRGRARTGRRSDENPMYF